MIREHYPFRFERDENNVLYFKLEPENLEARLFVLEEDIFRIVFLENGRLRLPKTWLVAPGCPDVPYEGRDRLDLSFFSLPKYDLVQTDGRIQVSTSKLKAVVELDGFKMEWFIRSDGRWVSIARDRRTQAYNLGNSLGEGVCHYLERRPEEQYFGLGEKTGDIDRYGRRFRMLNVDPMGYDAETTDPLYKHVPFYITRNRKEGCSFGLFYDNMASSVFDFGAEMDNYHGPYRYFQAEDGDLDYYVIAGPKIADVVEKFTWLTGRPMFPPKWSIGYSGSSMAYTDSPNAQEDLQQFVRDCELHDIPCDSFQLSSGYTSIGKKRYVFNWDRSKIPSPQKLAESFHSRGLKLCANVKPCLLKDHPHYQALKERGLFVRSRDGKEPEVSQFWDGLGSYLDFTNPETINWWKDQIKENLLAYGIDATWNDNNEYEIWDSKARSHGFGEPIEIGLIRPLQALLMMKASFEAQKEFETGLRPYVISRSGCPGMQRYAQTWTGDNRTDWKTLKYNIRMGIGLSLSGIYNFGHDVGGFAGPAPEPELFVRWVQNGIFHPRFTIHSWNDDGTVNEPWMYPEETEVIRNLIRFRYRLMPYFYQLFYEAHSRYRPIIRPVFYDFEGDPNTFKDSDDFMLGDSLLVASVTEKGVRMRDVYLPENDAGWYDFHTGKWFAGGQTVTVSAPLDQLPPLFVRGGSVVPINDSDIRFGTKSRDTRGLLLFPHPGEGETKYHLFEDDGVSDRYSQGEYAEIRITMRTVQGSIRITVYKTGPFTLPYNRIRLYLPPGYKSPLTVNGRSLKQNREGVYEWLIS